MLHKNLFTVFFVFSFIYISAIAWLPYQFDYLLKILPILTLLVATYFNSQGKLRAALLFGLFASGVGDVMLALSFSNAFLFGLSAFLIAQLTYTAIFIKYKRSTALNRLCIKQKSLIGMVLFLAISMAFYILPHTNEMLVPVTIYLVVITAMGITALLSGLSFWVSIGAISFVISDAILATSLFREPIIFSTYLVMISYYFAQFSIVYGLLKSYKLTH